jgi:putative hydrolase of the HAD superfamily
VPPTSTTAPKALLFDLGGVLIEIDFGRALAAWQPHSVLSLAEMRERFTFDAQYDKHERGEIDAARYFAHLADMLKLDATADDIRAGWNAILIAPIAETLAMVEAVRTRLPCFLFSNTNATHHAAWSAAFPEVTRLFERLFCSHMMGLRKPEPEAFRHVVQGIGVPPGEILFFDDLPANVAGALGAGLQAVQVRSPTDIRLALANLRGMAPA